jgi:N-acetylmuramoyl-L-alanine amidase
LAESRPKSRSALRFLAAPLLLVALALPAGRAAIGQEHRSETDAEAAARAAAEVFGSDVGVLRARGVDHPLPFTNTVQGPVVSLQAVVGALGGELTSDPLGQSTTLAVLDRRYVLGAGSAAMTEGERIVQLSRSPLAGMGGLEVPLDALQQSYGERLGFRFDWNAADHRLEVAGAGRGDLQVELSSVHVGGTTSLVVTLAEDSPSRLERLDQEVQLVFPGRRITVAGRLPSPDPLVAGVAVDANVVRVLLRPGAEAADPYRVARGGRTQVVLDLSQGGPRAGPSPLASSPGNGFKIVIDPGHGGTESGAVGPSGTLEKDLTLAIARLLRSRLEARLPAQIVLTRDDDSNLDLVSRTAVANQNQADLFLSVHLNSAAAAEAARGAETYILDAAASDARAEAAASFENLESRGEGAAPAREEPSETPVHAEGADASQLDLQLILWDLAQTRHLAESLRLATFIQQELNQALELRDRGVKQAPFKVLTGANMPATLIELGFLSHPEEEARLRDPAYRGRLVDALVDAIVRYWASRRGGSTLLPIAPAGGTEPEPEPNGAEP